MQLLLVLAMMGHISAPPALGAERTAHTCLSPSETRTAVQERKLADPFAMLRNAARTAGGEPLRSRLCRWDDKYVYEMALLRRDGKVVRIYLDAVDGKPISQP